MRVFKRLTSILLMLLLCSSTLYGCKSPASDTSSTTPDPADTTPDAEVSGDETQKTLSDFEKVEPANGKIVKVACIGDSITYGTGLSNPLLYSYPAQLQMLLGKKNYAVGNFGKGGAYALDADSKYNAKDAELSYRNTTQYKDSLSYEPDVVIIMLGSNDIRSLTCDAAVEEYIDAIQSLALEYAALPTVKMTYIASCKYTSSGNDLIRQMANGELARITKRAADEIGFPFIDIHGMTREYMDVHIHYTSDRAHPTEEGYEQIAKAMYAGLLGIEPDLLTYPESESGVVYVKDGGKGDGSSPENAIDSFAKAVGLLRNDGGTIVICGPYATSYTIHLPINKKKITVTSVYDGIDYRQSANAKFTFNYSLSMFGDFEYDDIDFHCAAASKFFICNYNNVKIGDGVSCVLDNQDATYLLFLVGVNVSHDYAPASETTLSGDCSIEINGGTWLYVRCGNRRSGSASPVGDMLEGSTMTVTINGGTFTNTGGTNITAATGMNSTYGTCRLIINGGTFKGPLYAVSRAGTNTTGKKATMSGKVYLEINGGSFAGQIIAIQDTSVNVTGEIHVKCIASLQNKLSGQFTTKEIT